MVPYSDNLFNVNSEIEHYILEKKDARYFRINTARKQCKQIILNEPHREKTGFLPMRKQRRRSASR